MIAASLMFVHPPQRLAKARHTSRSFKKWAGFVARKWRQSVRTSALPTHNNRAHPQTCAPFAAPGRAPGEERGLGV